jgi:two-component system, NarL family, nitrate/nitrite response regulator NarL
MKSPAERGPATEQERRTIEVGDRIVIVEDHGLIAHTVATALRARGAEVAVLDPALLDDVVTTATADAPDLVLLDLDLGPRGEATPLIAPLVESGTRVLMVTGVDDPVRHARCVQAGAVGVLQKSGSFDDLVGAIEQVLDTGGLLDRHGREELLAVLRDHEAEQRERLRPFEALTRREAEVLGALVRGQTVEAIARDAVVSVATVRSQVRAILTKLDAGSQVVAIAKAREVGWVPPQERRR